MAQELRHIAFIPDGNRRFAKENGLPTLEGHRRGYELFKKTADWCYARNISEVTFWGFSTENWKRSKEEVGYLMELTLKALTKDIKAFVKDRIQLRVIGRRADLSSNILKAIEEAEAETAAFSERRVNILFNYGGRAEILAAAQTLVAAGYQPEEITDEVLKAHLWTHDVSDPDLVIRTSGEQRLSGFMPWGGVYSELYFTSSHWPAFSEEELDKAIAWFSDRERRFGGNSMSL